MEDPKTKTIRNCNDVLRRTMFIGGGVFMTSGIKALPEDDQSQIVKKVRDFNDFNEDNDPYGEHDFGGFDHGGQKIFWKIVYYNLDMSCPQRRTSRP